MNDKGSEGILITGTLYNMNKDDMEIKIAVKNLILKSLALGDNFIVIIIKTIVGMIASSPEKDIAMNKGSPNIQNFVVSVQMPKMVKNILNACGEPINPTVVMAGDNV